MDAVSVVPPTKARTSCLCNCVGVPCPPRHEQRRRRRHPHRKNKDLESFLPPGENFARRALSASLPADPPFRLTKVLSREGAQGATLLFLKKTRSKRERRAKKKNIKKTSKRQKRNASVSRGGGSSEQARCESEGKNEGEMY